MCRHRLFSNCFLVQLAVMLLLVRPTFAQKQTAKSPISQTAIAELLSRRGLDVQPSQVHLPPGMVSKHASPELKVISTNRLGEHQTLIGIRCQPAGECLPFNATIDIPSEEALAVLKSSVGPNLTGSSSRAHAFVDGARADTASAGLQRSTEAKVKLGCPVTLVIREDRMEIHLPAVAMDSGSSGARVRVRTMTPEKTFYAVVVDDSTVLGQTR